MAGEPALTKLQTALVTLIESIPGEYQCHPNRETDEPLQESERPAYVPRIVECTFDTQLGGGMMDWRIVIDVDMLDNSEAGDTITNKLAVMLSLFIAALNADPTLGGLVGEIVPRSFTASSDSVPDLGCATLTLEAVLLTPEGDFNTVMGASGPIV